MRIAIEGCCHGELDKIYESILYIQEKNDIRIDLLLICGDFQSVRNQSDLAVLACPEKYLTIGSFYKYYTGEKKAPVLTIFIGGNHEASNYLWELYHGGWVCPNIYFLGYSGVVRFGNLRISGISGIYKKHDYDNGYYEKQPYNESHLRSIYHVRKFNVYRLAQIKKSIDIFLSHDWPRGMALYGNVRKLLHLKPFLAGEINTYTLGSYPNEYLLKLLKPKFWFSAHLHVKFAAIYYHEQDFDSTKPQAVSVDPESRKPAVSTSRDVPEYSNDYVGRNDATHAGASHTNASHNELKQTVNPDKISVSDASNPSDSEEQGDTKKSHGMNKLPDLPNATRFLALDKCLPGRNFLQIIEIDVPPDEGNPCLRYDQEWLSIVRATWDLMPLSKQHKQMPSDLEIQARLETELDWVKKNVSQSDMRISDRFAMTAPYFGARLPDGSPASAAAKYVNPQTQYFCDLLQLPNNLNTGGVVVGWDGVVVEGMVRNEACVVDQAKIDKQSHVEAVVGAQDMVS